MTDTKKPTKDREAELCAMLGLTADEMDARIEGVLNEAARKEFGPPYSDLRADEFSDTGLTITRGSKIKPKVIHVPPDDDPLMVAARTAFPNTAKQKLAEIVHRYRDVYEGIPEADAVEAILAGFSSPWHAMTARRLKRRPLKGIAP